MYTLAPVGDGERRALNAATERYPSTLETRLRSVSSPTVLPRPPPSTHEEDIAQDNGPEREPGAGKGHGSDRRGIECAGARDRTGRHRGRRQCRGRPAATPVGVGARSGGAIVELAVGSGVWTGFDGRRRLRRCEVGGLTGREVLAFVRSLAGVRFGGFDLVEVSPPYDGPGQTTALLAANVAYEFLSLIALAR